MPTKHQMVTELAAKTADRFTRDPEAYLDFLATAGNNYKYRFQEQLLIYAQKPDATACAEIGTWNRLGRWVKKGTRGIALLTQDGGRNRLRHVFDLSDTDSEYGYEITLWQFRKRYADAVIEALEHSYGALEEHHGFPADLPRITDAIVEDNSADYIRLLESVKHGSLLEDLDELNLSVWLRSTVKNSVAFSVLTRCGYDARRYYTAADFPHLYDFDSPETIAVLGDAASDIAELTLREIEATVRSLDRAEKNQARTVAKSRPKDDTVRDNNERSDEHGTDLSAGGRLSAAQPRSAGEPEDREVWEASARVPPQQPQTDLHWDASAREPQRAPGADRPGGQRADGRADRADGAAGGRRRAPESVGSDAVGAADEQHPAESRGNRAARPDLRLTDEEPEAAETALQPSGHDFDARSDIPYYHCSAEKQELLRISDALKDHRVGIMQVLDEILNIP